MFARLNTSLWGIDGAGLSVKDKSLSIRVSDKYQKVLLEGKFAYSRVYHAYDSPRASLTYKAGQGGSGTWLNPVLSPVIEPYLHPFSTN